MESRRGYRGGGREGKETKSDNERRKARRGKCVQGHGNEYLQIQCKVLADALKVYVKQKKNREHVEKRRIEREVKEDGRIKDQKKGSVRIMRV